MIELLGFLLPPFIDFINSAVANSKTRFWVSALVCLAVGTFLNFIEHNGFAGYNGLTLMEITETISKSAMYVLGIAQVSYNAIWDNTKLLGGLRDNLGLNAKTNGIDEGAE